MRRRSARHISIVLLKMQPRSSNCKRNWRCSGPPRTAHWTCSGRSIAGNARISGAEHGRKVTSRVIPRVRYRSWRPLLRRIAGSRARVRGVTPHVVTPVRRSSHQCPPVLVTPHSTLSSAKKASLLPRWLVVVIRNILTMHSIKVFIQILRCQFFLVC